MWPVPPSLIASVNSSDGRKLHVGECALFQPSHDSPSFVGLIRRLIVAKEDTLSLRVNWLYRPTDVKLPKGTSLEAAPNEVFYSFHQDEIPAASLLHPCKVAFLRKGVELPSGIPSFVCRRVYDIKKKCLYWLTAKNYLTERQEEVDQLLDKTQVEMDGALQGEGHSPKPLNGPNGTTQLKSSTENVQNISSMPTQVKSKKREHGIHSSESVKRERLSKADDSDSAQVRPENMLKTEIAKFTDKGGLVDFEGVEKLIELMRPESAEKKLDLACRVMLVDVVSVTDKFECLTRFVQRRGLHVIDEWLQEVHKGKIGDGSPKATDKSIDDFLFALLRALDKLPVNLLALQTCNIGKSVNHLRSHKSSEIQKKARSLVDTWKKRVEAEMNVIETRSGTRRGGSWPNKSMMSDAKISTSQPSSLRGQQGKPNAGEPIAKSPESPGSTKSAIPVTGSLGVPHVPIKEEKSNSCSPSANNGQSCSSEHDKTGASCKEDAPSTSGSINKNSSGVSHSRKSSTMAGVQKEGGIGKSSSGKCSPIGATPEGAAETSSIDNTNSQRFIVRLANTGRTPVSGGSLDDASSTFGKSSPKQDHIDRRTRGKGDAPPMDLCQGKEGTGSDDVKKGIVSPTAEPDRDGEAVEKLTEAAEGAGSASVGTLKAGKTYEASYSSINALAESCAKFPQASMSVPVGDDVGMNLLASVAASEMSRSDVSQGGSPENKQLLPADNSKVTNGHVEMEQVSFSGYMPAKGGSQRHVLPSSASALPQNSNMALEVKPAALVADKSASLSSIDTTNAGKERDGVVKSNDPVTSVLPETKSNDESTSLLSSEMLEDENKVMQKEPIKDSDLPTTSCGYTGLGQEGDDNEDRKMGSHAKQSVKTGMDPDSFVSHQTNEHAKENKEKNEVLLSGVPVPPGKSSVVHVQEDRAEGDNSEQHTSRAVSTISVPVSEVSVKLDFDLNELLPSDDGIQGDVERSSVPGRFSAVHTPSAITVAAAAKGSFFPSDSLLRGKAELGWKGSAATSAFRPAEPRKVIDAPDNTTSKQTRALLDFDLNVGVLEDVSQNNNGAPSGGGGLDLDLNACEESPEVGPLSVNFGRVSIPQLPSRSHFSGRFSTTEPSSSMGFDLNNGPLAEEVGVESTPLSRNGMQFLSNVPSIRMNNMDMGTISSWFPPSSAYPAVVPGRGEQSYPMVPGAASSSQRMLNPGTSFNPEMFRGPVLSSSPAVGYSSTTPFQFPGFPFETNFSMPPNTYPAVSTAYVGSSGGQICFPTIPSQLVGPSGVVSTPYRPYVMSLPGGSGNIAPDNRKWGSQGLDLNSGPGGADLEPSGFRQLPLAGSQSVTDEQLKMFQQMAAGGGGILKRKEPVDGWDGDRMSYKHHPSWQ